MHIDAPLPFWIALITIFMLFGAYERYQTKLINQKRDIDRRIMRAHEIPLMTRTTKGGPPP